MEVGRILSPFYCMYKYITQDYNNIIVLSLCNHNFIDGSQYILSFTTDNCISVQIESLAEICDDKVKFYIEEGCDKDIKLSIGEYFLSFIEPSSMDLLFRCKILVQKNKNC